MEDMKKRKMDEGSNNGSGETSTTQDYLRSLLDPLNKSQLVDLLSRLGSQYPSIAEEIKGLASADPVHRKLFVRGLAWNTTSETLCAAFQMHGEIEEGAVIYDKATGKSRGYGFITYKHMESAQSALGAPSRLIDSRMAVCNLACEGLTGASTTPDLAQRKLYVGGLSPEISSEMLLNFFGRYGDIEEGSVAYDKDTNESRGFGFVTYKTVEASKKAIDDPHKLFGGRTIIVKLADTHRSKTVQTHLPAPMVPLQVPMGAGGYAQPDIRRSITRYLRYHPINEFEIFFESMGLKPQEYSSLLPRDLMYLSDDDLLLENYHVMCNYGIARNKMGKIYKEATEVFRYDYGVLALKLKAYEKLGLSSSFIAKVVVRSPDLLIGDANIDFIKVLELLRKGGLEYRRIEKLLSDKSTYNWSQLLSLLNLFGKAGYNDEQLSELISQKPWILREDSVDRALLLIGFLLKFGSTMNQICSLFLQFPKVQVEKFASNLRHCFLFLNDINMEAYEIGKLFRSHPIFIGSFTLKKTNSLLSRLNAGKKRICEVIQENPEIMKKWVKGSKIEWLPDSGEELRSQMLKTKFFLDLGFVENSDEMKRALKVFRGRGAELQERFDCLVIAGLDRKDVCEMIKVSPQILNQKKEVIETKIDFLINDLGFPVSSLVRFPSYLSYTMQRAKLRLTMYNWLKEQGKVNPMLSFSTIVGCTDNVFLSQYVDRHPRGPEIWEDLKKEICSA